MGVACLLFTREIPALPFPHFSKTDRAILVRSVLSCEIRLSGVWERDIKFMVSNRIKNTVLPS